MRRAERSLTHEAHKPSAYIPIDKMAYRVPEAAHTLAISRSRLYQLVAAGEIRILKDGARTLILRAELEGYLDRLSARQPS